MTLTQKSTIGCVDFTENAFTSLDVSYDGTVYAAQATGGADSKGELWGSSDSGILFTSIENGTTIAGIRSICCSKTGSKLYMFEPDATPAGSYGICKYSNDFGVSFTTNNTLPQYLGYASDCSDDGTKVVMTGKNSSFDATYIYISEDYAASWTARGSSLNYRDVKCSGDFNKIVAIAYGDKIYVSYDSGVSFTGMDSNRNWNHLAMSYDGKYIAATVLGGQIYVSSDYGATFTAKDSNRNWSTISMSRDGKYMIAGEDLNGNYYISSDYGGTWTAKTFTSNKIMGSCISNNGELFVVYDKDGYLLTSVDYGVTLQDNRLDTGTWTSPEINPVYTLNTITFGWLSWEEENTDNESYTTVRVDIKSSDLLTTYISDIILNSDLTASDINTGDIPASTPIKLVYRMYRINNAPNPIVSNINLRHTIWKDEMVVNNKGKKVLVDRSFNSSQTYTPVEFIDFGYTTGTTFSETSTTLPSKVNTSHFGITSYATDTTNNTKTILALVDETESYIPNTTVFNCLSLNNSDTTDDICGLIKIPSITKSGTYRYYVYIKYRVLNDNSSKLITRTLKNEMIYRYFNSYTQSAREAYRPGKYLIGYVSSFSDTISDLDYVYGTSLLTDTNTSVTANKLVDSGGFSTFAAIGRTVANNSEDLVANITALDSSTQLSLSSDIFKVPGTSYIIYDDTPVSYSSTSLDYTNFTFTSQSLLSDTQGNGRLFNCLLHTGIDSPYYVLGGDILASINKTSVYSYIFIDNFKLMPLPYDV